MQVNDVQTLGGAIAVPPHVPGLVIAGEPRLSATGSEWAAVRTVDGHRIVLKTVPVTHLAEAQTLAVQQAARYDRVDSDHLIRRHGAIVMADGMLGLLLDEVTGGSLAQLIDARSQLTVGEMVTTVAPLFRALAELHAEGVVHGDLSPNKVLFTPDGRPMIGDLGVALLLNGGRGTSEESSGFAAPEVVGGAEASAGSDVYAMAAMGWFCLTGAPPGPGATRPALTALRPETPPRVVQLLTTCLSDEPASRLAAGEAAVELFEAAPAESVALASASDPAADITRRIRAAAVAAPDPEPRRTGKPLQRLAVIAIGALLVVAVIGTGVTWLTRRSSALAVPIAGSLAQPSPMLTPTALRPTTPTPGTSRGKVVSARTSRGSSEVLTAASSPRVAAAGLLQALVDARALAYLTRNSALLDLVYAPGATKAAVDRANIAAARKNGGTYLGLSYVISDVTYLGSTTDTAQLRATILTPAYHTGQPDGREIPHPKETLGPCTFSLSLTAEGWRILSLTVPE